MPPMIEFPLDLPEVRVLKTELKKDEFFGYLRNSRSHLQNVR
jgi:hypothetical protein